jgi:hypothetical protein
LTRILFFSHHKQAIVDEIIFMKIQRPHELHSEHDDLCFVCANVKPRWRHLNDQLDVKCLWNGKFNLSHLIAFIACKINEKYFACDTKVTQFIPSFILSTKINLPLRAVTDENENFLISHLD